MHRVILASIGALVMAAGATWYIYLIIRDRKVKPVLPTWIVLASTLLLSLFTYWTSPNHELISGIAVVTGALLSAVPILIVVGITSRLRGKKPDFNLFQKWCLGISGLILLYWVISVWGFKMTGLIPYISTQALMFVGYLVTAEKLCRAKENTESFFLWGSICAASVIGLYLGIEKNDNLSIIYSCRAVISAATILVIMYWLERKNS